MSTFSVARHLRIAAVVALAFLRCPPDATAGKLLIAEEQRAGETRPRSSRYELSSDGLRMTGVRGRALSTIIYRRADGRFFLVDDKGASYREVSRTQILGAVAKGREALDELESKLRTVNGKDKEIIEGLLAAGRKYLKDSAGGYDSQIIYKRMEGEAEMLGLKCARYEAFIDGKVAAEIWTASAEAIGLTEADLAVLDEVGGLFETAVSSLTGIKETSSFLPRARPGQFEGVPIRRIRFKEGLPASDWKLNSVKEADFPAAHFNPPPEFRKKSLVE